jgi:hypothetical protein
MFKRFIRAMEYKSYCMSIEQLRSLGYFDEARAISEYKDKVYKTK